MENYNNYIFGKKKISPFQKCIVFHGYYGDIYLAVIMISPIFHIFSQYISTLFACPESILLERLISLHRIHNSQQWCRTQGAEGDQNILCVAITLCQPMKSFESLLETNLIHVGGGFRWPETPLSWQVTI